MRGLSLARRACIAQDFLQLLQITGAGQDPHAISRLQKRIAFRDKEAIIALQTVHEYAFRQTKIDHASILDAHIILDIDVHHGESFG